MPDVLIPADLSLILRRALIDAYQLGARAASLDAEACVARPPERAAEELTADLAKARARLADLERLFLLLGDDLTEPDALEVPREGRDGQLLHELIGDAIDNVLCEGGPRPDAEWIVAAGLVLSRLLRLRGELEPEAVMT